MAIDLGQIEGGASYALIQSAQLKKWLDSFDLEIVWLSGGEKSLFSSDSENSSVA